MIDREAVLDTEVGDSLPVGSRFVGTPRLGLRTSEYGGDYRVGSPERCRWMDVGVLGEARVRIWTGPGLQHHQNVPAVRVIDAAGRLVLPGGVDPHTPHGDAVRKVS